MNPLVIAAAIGGFAFYMTMRSRRDAASDAVLRELSQRSVGGVRTLEYRPSYDDVLRTYLLGDSTQ